MTILCGYAATGAEIRIKSADELIQFSNSVNGGTNYTGYTVFLDSDLDFTGKTMEPIGNSTKFFQGYFDGLGHVISNLTMSSSSRYVGLFGYSGLLNLKNVILDSYCSITSSSSGRQIKVSNSRYNVFSYTGGIIGYCYATAGPCTVESSVNMGNVTFKGTLQTGGSYYSYSYVGGIAGPFDSPYYVSTVKNCANYGTITFSGKSMDSNIGGIAGISHGYSSSSRMYVYNCLNYGTIIHKGTATGAYTWEGLADTTNTRHLIIA